MTSPNKNKVGLPITSPRKKQDSESKEEFSITNSIFEFFLGSSPSTSASLNFENPSLSEDVSSLKKIDFHMLENDRPKGIPPKSEKEKQFLNKEIDRMNQKLKETLKAKEDKEKQFLKKKQEREEFIRKSLIIWEKEIIPNWKQKKYEKRTISLWKHGLPSKVRGKLWKLAIGNVLGISEDLYQILIEKKIEKPKKKEDKQTSLSTGLNKESTIELISIDVSRTFHDLGFFQCGGPLHEPLQNVLESYVKYRPDIGYIQGMSYLVAMLLLNMDEYSSFVCLANMIHANHFLKFFRMELKQICIICETINLLLAEYLPGIHLNFDKQGIKLQSFIMDWFITLFSKSFEMEIAARLWDRYFLEGEVFLYRATLGIFEYFKEIIEFGSFEEIMKSLTRIPRNLNSEELFKFIDGHKMVTKKIFEKAKKEAENTVSKKQDVYL